MITDLCHRLTTDGTWSRLHCVRDSFGRKPIKETNGKYRKAYREG